MVRAFVFACVCVCSIGPAAWGQASPAGGAGDEIFGLTRVHQIEITVAADGYAKMNPPPAKGFFGAGRAQVDPAHAGAGNMGYEFEYVTADVRVDDQSYPHVGLRYKGSGTYLMSQFRAKRSFKIDFDRHDASLRFHGLAKLNLNNGVMDPSKAREALAYELFRAVGVPAPRTAFAEVVLSVPERFDKEYLGLYTVVEQVDERFLAAHFDNGNGLLLKPEGIRGLPHLGDDPEKYKATYNPKSKPGRGDWSRLVELTRLINDADEAEFRSKIGEYLDVDGFIRFLGVNAMLSSLDGFIGMGHNFYLYLSPETGKFTFIPWDLDLAFGAFNMYGTPDQSADLSVDHPHLGENKLIDRLLAMPEVEAAYREQVRRLLEEAFTGDQLAKDVAAIAELAKEPIAREDASSRKRGEATGAEVMRSWPPALPLDVFIARRAESVAAQLGGTKDGYAPRVGGFGMWGGLNPGGSPRGEPRR